MKKIDHSLEAQYTKTRARMCQEKVEAVIDRRGGARFNVAAQIIAIGWGPPP